MGTLLPMVLAAPLFMSAPAASGTAAPPGFVLRAQSRHFVYYTSSGRDVDPRRNERDLEDVQRALGVSLARRARYFRYDSPQQLAVFTGVYAAGVTFARAGEIHSTQESHAHEIVHLVAGELGDPGPFFQEGLAVALTAKRPGRRGEARGRFRARGWRLSQAAARFGSLDPETAYATAGSFVASLIHKHGVGRVAALFRACAGGRGDSEAAFLQVFGQSLDEAGAAWAASVDH